MFIFLPYTLMNWFIAGFVGTMSIRAVLRTRWHYRNCIAIGLDNDCTGATVGSIAGACLGFEAIPAYWYEKFNNKVATYLTGYEELALDDVIARFIKLNN